MKKFLITTVGILTLGAVAPAFAGPDFAAIERARQAKLAAQVEYRKDAEAGNRPNESTSSIKAECPPSALVLPLDHGPHAQTTPAQNQARKDRYAAKVALCAENRK